MNTDGFTEGNGGNEARRINGRLPVADVQRLERLLGGDPVTEAMVIRFIGEKYGAKNLFYVPHKVAEEIFKRPNDFLRAVRKHCEPELGF